MSSGKQRSTDEPAAPSDIVFSAAVKNMQRELGSREMFERRLADGRDFGTAITADLARFIGQRDSFYLGTASAAGQPHIQHRGGPPGFLHVLGERRLGFADFAGNRQYVTLGNASENDRATIFLMDYAHRQRVKLWGRLSVSDESDLMARLSPAGYPGKPQRVLLFEVESWDVNCQQHIVPRLTEADLAPAIQKLHARIAELEAEVAALRASPPAP
ncbi:MAG: pyridoxamine 5'-phosphate oxidase family protein [Alphaproteobacteria bacterium]